MQIVCPGAWLISKNSAVHILYRGYYKNVENLFNSKYNQNLRHTASLVAEMTALLDLKLKK